MADKPPDRPDLTEEDKHFLESDLAKGVAGSPEFQKMLEDQQRVRDFWKATTDTQQKVKKIRASQEQAKAMRPPRRTAPEPGRAIRPEPGSLLDSVAKFGDGLSRLGDSLATALTKAPAEQIQPPPFRPFNRGSCETVGETAGRATAELITV